MQFKEGHKPPSKIPCRSEQLFAASNAVITAARVSVMFTDDESRQALKDAVAAFDRLNRGLMQGEGT